ncbi:MAG: DNA methyltransferase [Bacillota bacterium]
MSIHSDIEKYLEVAAIKTESGFSAEKKTMLEEFTIEGIKTCRHINEFWTSGQRQASSIHEISYRACFKPQLPKFFINLFTETTDTVYDPFAGRGTTIVEAALMGRKVIANDVNPLSKILSKPRLAVPSAEDIEKRLSEIPFYNKLENEIDLSMFYHYKTEAELLSLRKYLTEKTAESMDDIDSWIRMVATNRLTGHSKGFFSVYTMPPNQAVSAERQVSINLKLCQRPEYRDVRSIILRKTKQLIRNLTSDQLKQLKEASLSAIFMENDAAETKTIPMESVDLVVTSPPFLDVVQYSKDNWLRCWFNKINLSEIEKRLTMATTLDKWSASMRAVLRELYRITRPGGWIAFEVGEVKNGLIKLEEKIIPLGVESGFECAGVVINQQYFTKTSNIWGVKNNTSGTNSNRIVLFNKKLQGQGPVKKK